MKFGRNLDGQELRIYNPFGSKRPSYDLVAKKMEQAGLEYSTEVGHPISYTMPPFMRFKLVTFYFSEEKERDLIAIFLSDEI